MRIVQYFIAGLICTTMTTAQDVHQPPAAMTFSQPQLINSGQQSKFLYSWNWSSGPAALNQRYRMNAFHTLETFNIWWSVPTAQNSFNFMPDSLELLWKPWNLHGDNEPLDAPATPLFSR